MYFISCLFEDIVTNSVVLDVLKVFIRFKWSKLQIGNLRLMEIVTKCLKP